jgi:hypothetical protein
MSETDLSTRVAVLRQSNEFMRERADDIDAPMPFFCECEHEGCFAPAWLTAAEYDQARSWGEPIHASFAVRDAA